MSKSKNFTIVFILPIFVLIGFLLLVTPPRDKVQARQALQNTSATLTATAVPLNETLFAFVDAPGKTVSSPYVLLTVFGNIPKDVPVEIRGTINDTDGFVCSGRLCELSLPGDSIIRFKASTPLGHVSSDYVATIRVTQPATLVYRVTVEAFEPDIIYADSCSNIWSVISPQFPQWARFLRTPAQLDTGETLHYLAGRLIKNGVVDASECYNGGMVGTAPSTCGIEKAQLKMVDWQNQFNFDIWLAARDVGIPPILLKTLFLRESQFWPGNSRYFMAEFGLAQINDYGADVALRWDSDLYKNVCSKVYSNCAIPYNSRSGSSRAMLRGALLEMIDAQCPTCEYSLDMEVAHASVNTVAHILRSNCIETRYVLVTNKVSVNNYEDLWKLTMSAYHSGIYCLDMAVKSVVNAKEMVSWQTVSQKLTCPGAKQYVDDFWYSLTTFDSKVLPAGTYETARVKSSAAPTPTVVPTPTLVVSSAHVLVQVFVDKNANNVPDSTEGVNGVVVKLSFPDGGVVFGTTDKGKVVFDLSGREIGQKVVVTLLGLYRSNTIVIPEKGEVQVLFRFSQPILPTSAP